MSTIVPQQRRKYTQLGQVLLRAIGQSFSQDAIAKEICISQEAVHSWVIGKNRPTPSNLGHLAGLLQLEPYLLASLAAYEDVTALEKVLTSYQQRCLIKRAQPTISPEQANKDLRRFLEPEEE